MAWSRPMQALNRTRRAIWDVPVGLQLSVIYALLLVATLSLLGWALYLQLDGYLVRNTAERLERTMGPSLAQPFPVFRSVPSGGSDFEGDRSRWRITHPTQEQIASFLVGALSGPDIDVAVLSEDGLIVDATRSQLDGTQHQLPPLPKEWQASMIEGQSAHWVVSDDQGGRQLVMVTPFVLMPPAVDAGARIYVEQATSLAAADAVLNQMRLYLALGIVAGTVLGVLAGLWLTRVVLRPLDRMANTAEAIAGGDLERRLRLPSGRNEVARLGTAFDNMVGRLAASLETQRRFVADASHELRTPLTSLEGLSEMLLMGADQGDTNTVQRTVRAMHGELARMGRLVADLLTLSRLDGRAPMQRVALDVAKTVAEVAAQMAPLAESKSVHLAMQSEPQAWVRGDPDKLKQVILNLVDNALRYTPPEGLVMLTVRTDQPTRTVQIAVRDTGPGIAAKDLPRIFDRFYRGDTSRARTTGNTGLGLAIARAITEAHGGTIAVQSNPGEGACFIVSLPLSRTTGAPEKPEKPSEEKALSHSA